MERESQVLTKSESPDFTSSRLVQNRLAESLNTFYRLWNSSPRIKLTDEIIYTPAFVSQWAIYFTKLFANLKAASEITQSIKNNFSPSFGEQIKQVVFKNYGLMANSQERSGRQQLSEGEKEIFLHFYTTKFGGISLSEVENLPLPFTIEEFKNVSNFIKTVALEHPRTGRDDVFEKIAVPFMYLVCNQNPPEKIAPLVKRLTSYFDFWKRVVIDYQIDEGQEELFLEYFQNWLEDDLSPFVAASTNFRFLGFLPFSLFQILATRRNQSLNREGWDHIIEFFLGAQDETGKIFGQKKSTQTLKEGWDELSYDKVKDQRLAAFLLSNFGNKDLTVIDFAHQVLANQRLVEQIVNHPIKAKDLAGKVPQVFEFQTDEKNLPIKTGCAAFTEYFHPLIDLEFEDFEDHLLVQITPDGEIFGIPILLETDYPNYSEFLKGTILKIYLEFLDSKQAEKEEKQKAVGEKPKSTAEVREKPYEIPIVVDYSLGKPKERAMSFKKRKSTRQASVDVGQTKTESRNSLPEHEEKTRRTVFYSKNSIAQLMTGANDGEVLRVLRGMKSFEVGFGNVKKLKTARHGSFVIEENTWRLRIGKWRVLLKEEDGVYYPYYIGRRQSGSQYAIS